MTPQETVERALDLSTADGCVVVTTSARRPTCAGPATR